MARTKHTPVLNVLLACLLAVSGIILPEKAGAGPQVTFGPDNEGMLQLDYKGQFQMLVRDTGSGPNADDTTAQFTFRRNRLALMGQYGDTLSMYVQTEFVEDQNVEALAVSTAETASEFQVLDAVIRFKFHDGFRISVGKFKYNFVRENLEDCVMPLTLDRSLFIRPSFVTTRDKGVAVWGNILNGLFQYRLDAMNGRMPTATTAPQPESNFRYSARIHVSLLDPENSYGYKGTYLGEKKVLTVGGAAQFEPEVAYADTATPSDPKDYTAWTADLFFEYPLGSIGTVTASAAYEKIDMDDAYLGPNADPDTTGINGEKEGYYVKAGYMLPVLPIQFFGRYERWSFAVLQNVPDQEIVWYGGGMNYYFRGQNLKLTLEFSRTDFDTEGTFSGITSRDFNTFVTQLQLVF